ncbi:MAG: hypothetical protein Q9191_005456 [Dirinaria sp. TL-2023a]
MPHKHTRRGKDPSTYDLPPTAHARPLPTYKAKPKSTTRISKSSSKASKASISPHTRSVEPTYLLNDTPRAFARLLRPPPPPRAGLDDGASRARKKRKANPPESASHSTATRPSTAGTQATAPQIQPGESLSNFSARVDASLPVSGLAAKGKRIKGAVERQTKTERKMQRMVREWRAEEEKRRQRRQEAVEEQEDYESENEDGHAEAANGKKKGKKRRIRKGASDEDIWAHIAPKHSSADRDGGKEVGAGLVGLHDVVEAPPRFAKAPREKFRVSFEGGPKKGGIGLKRQAELGEARREVIGAYRALMKEKGRTEKSVG